MDQLRPTGFSQGLFSLLRALSFVWREPAAFRLSLVPAFVACVCWTACMVLAVRFVPESIAAWLPSLARPGRGLSLVIELLVLLVAAPVGLLLTVIVTPVVCAPVFERLIRLREQALGLPPRPAAGFFRELLCALSAQLWSLCLLGPVLLLLWALSLVAPPLAPFVAVLHFLVSAAWLALSLLDYPLSLRGLGFRARVALMRKSPLSVLGFGAACVCLFAIPLFGLWGLPVAVVAAAELAASLERGVATPT
jgi:uncharacterized protein involved in cysteine biosynthesis